MSDQADDGRDDERGGGRGRAEEAGIVDQQDALLHEMHEIEGDDDDASTPDD
jgi:hypothetical protein